MNGEIAKWIEDFVVPMYDSFDKGHQRDHAKYVTDTALSLSEHYDVDMNMVAVAAACHDLGLAVDRKTHHLESGRIIRGMQQLRRWFSEDQIETLAQAAEDHRASSKDEPRSIYGKIIAEADRQIIPDVVIRRTVQFGLKNYPELDREEHWGRTVAHLEEKYAEGGYLKLWIPESDNAVRLEELRTMIRDREKLRTAFDAVYKEERYREIIPRISSLLAGEEDMVAKMANLSAVLHRTFGFWWTGFYIVRGDVLVLGPFQGPLACMRIPFGKGVCGTAWKREETVVVPDVEQFPGHIACSSESRSEIVVPVWQDGRVSAVLDIDSASLATFDGTDQRYLEEILRTCFS